MSDINLFAETNFRNQRRQFGIKINDRRKHLYVVGKTGMGKTTLLENMAIQDIQAGRGVGIVDPHGEFAQKMLDFVPSQRINDVIYFNPADLDYPIAFNAIERVDPEHRHLVASGLVGVFKKIWAETWGPRLEYVLRNAILALLEYPGATLLGIMRMLTDKGYRQKVVDKIQDPVVKSFWVDEFSKYRGSFEVEAVAPIQNKVGQFLTNPLIRNIVGQTRSAIDIRKAMDDKKILIMNLSKGLIGEDTSALLGAMLITRLQLAAMSRVDIPEEERKDFYLYVDEFQNFATEAFANILSEARKYRLDLILAHQYIAQLVTETTTKVRDAVFGNVGTLISFRVGAQDAEYLEKEFVPEFSTQDLVNLDFAQIYLKLMIDGVASRPFSATTLAPFDKQNESYREKIIKISRERYASNRQEIEDKIAKWSGVIETEKEAKRKTSRPLFEAVCSECNKKIQVSFKPDGVRPVYCPECLEKVRKKTSLGQSRKMPETILRGQKTPMGQSVIQKGEPKVTKPEGKEISLAEVAKKEPVSFRIEKKRKQVDLEGLRKTIEESLAVADEEKNKKSKKKGGEKK
ncbi:MAG: type IV secretion system DNA-binding domain-containing protein [Candidatus Portnoybacteria bacterium]|nr:type IV secretion system DNA-binding domain-containing protein [Candidatus Portnoybacteria bacterium]